jgi:inosine/guanosine/xanthosine phosphorylase family protein
VTLAERLAGFRPRVLLTLGSGLGGLAEEVADALVIPAGEVGLPSSTVPGHAGRLVAGTLNEVPVLVQQGRVHLYEGVPAADVTATVRAAAEAGADTFLVTNAAGGIDLTFAPGDVMLITDQLNLAGTSPLRGPHFVDMTDAYDPGLRATAMDLAGDLLVTGVYAGLRGPAFETPAEVSMLRTLGASAVGMSTVLEVIAARALGLRIAGFSLITNVHRPGGTHTDHQEVLAAAANAGPRLATVVHDLLPHL